MQRDIRKALIGIFGLEKEQQASSRAVIGIWVQPLGQKLSTSQLPRPSSLTSMMYNFLITNSIVPKGIPVKFLIIFSVWNKTLSLIRKKFCHVTVFSIHTQYREQEHKGKQQQSLKKRRKAFLRINANHFSQWISK